MQKEEYRLVLVLGVILIVALFGALVAAYTILWAVSTFGVWFFVAFAVALVAMIIMIVVYAARRKKKTPTQAKIQEKHI